MDNNGQDLRRPNKRYGKAGSTTYKKIIGIILQILEIWILRFKK